MASRTFDDIVTEGMLKAGRDDLAERVRGYFNDWLSRQARSWPWPQLTAQKEYSVPAGTVLWDTMTDPLSRILDECWLYRTDRTARQRLRIRQVASAPLGLLDGGTGMPVSAQVFRDTDWFWSFRFDRATDRDYLVTFPGVTIPARIAAPWTDIPWYPEDDTCIQAVMVETLKYVNGPDDSSYQAALAELSEMVSIDRVRHGVTPSQNNLLTLDGGVFR